MRVEESDSVELEISQQEYEETSGFESFDYSINRYAVYQSAQTTAAPDIFSTAMAENPIDEQERIDMSALAPTTTEEMSRFRDNYLSIWKNELAFSLENLRNYLSEEELELLNASHAAWERSLESNQVFDLTLIESRGVQLGSWYPISVKIYLTNQTKERVFHIKYMTYLVETQVADRVPEKEQLWNVFHELN
ncbi:MAG: hypothetical protein FWE41_07735 [Coriobacteriia bacterium]|nr:hypothetical protein [Coriobacteriia bacterium]MCL2750131.1 hypothetical protein [Coriobacteriia bacterium]